MPRRFTLRCRLTVFHHSAPRRCGHRTVDRFIQANVLPRLGCGRHHRSRTGRLFIRVEVRSRARVHTPWQRSLERAVCSRHGCLYSNAIVSRHSPIAEIQLSHACGTSKTPEPSFGVETIYETRTICGMETTCGTQTIRVMERTICVLTGKKMFLLAAQGIGIAIGTVIATTGGMATDAPSLMERG